jgi:hypothetical protein
MAAPSPSAPFFVVLYRHHVIFHRRRFRTSDAALAWFCAGLEHWRTWLARVSLPAPVMVERELWLRADESSVLHGTIGRPQVVVSHAARDLPAPEFTRLATRKSLK